MKILYTIQELVTCKELVTGHISYNNFIQNEESYYILRNNFLYFTWFLIRGA